MNTGDIVKSITGWKQHKIELEQLKIFSVMTSVPALKSLAFHAPIV
jgi:hypothetical protein